MKNFWCFVLIMLMIIVIMPMLIVKGFGRDKSQELTEIDMGFERAEKTEKTAEKDIIIKVFNSDSKKVDEMPLEEYLKGVVAAEMPVEFAMEALKAQAIAARTYAYSRYEKLYLSADNIHSDADVCTDVHCQVWMSRERAMKSWGDSAEANWSRIEKAVNETKGIIITFDGVAINPLYHSNSGGRTENVEDVWATNEVPYLRSVSSRGEEKSSLEFKNTLNIKSKDFYDKLKKIYPDIKINTKNVYGDIKVISHSEGGRVMDIKIGNLTLKGTDIRNVFSLKSTNFTIEKGQNDTLNITTIGNGHGVGMSQWGANYMAQSGGDYKEILKYYYKGIDLENLNNY